MIVNSRKILVLARPNFKSGHVSLKMRKSGKDGMRFKDEEDYLTLNEFELERLLAGKVVTL